MKKDIPSPAALPGRLFLIAVAGIFLAACATDGDNERLATGMEASDPLEGWNRGVLKFNDGLRTVLLVPVAKGYRFIVPEPGRDGIRNVLDNLRGPVIFANDMFQGESKRAGITLARFMINSTVGIAGLFDVAEGLGLPKHNEDFGQTLAVHGVEPGAYLVIPVLGPSTVRDAFGLAADAFMDPLGWVLRVEDKSEYSLLRAGVDGIDLLERNLENLQDLKRNSLDFYSALKSSYIQNRQSEIRNGQPIVRDLPDYDLYEEETETP